MRRPLAVDLFCGLGGWTDALLAEGWRVVGFDLERHVYGEHYYRCQLVLQDVLTLHGSQFRDAELIVASPPCQEFSYMAMPWTRSKQIAAALRGHEPFPDGYRGSRTPAELTALFDACFRLQREASDAAGRYIPLIVENVRGAQRWVGRARWSFGSFFLWGDVPALMPTTMRAQKRNPDGTNHPPGSWFAIANSKERGAKNPGADWNNFRNNGEVSPHWRMEAGQKNDGGSWFKIGSPGQKETNRNPVHELAVSPEGVKGFTPSGEPLGQNRLGRMAWSTSIARKRASALIARIPQPLAEYIAHVFKP